jgi:lysine 2,3-aminomutase
MFKQKAAPAAAPERALTSAAHLLAAGLIHEHDLAAVAEVAGTFGIGISSQMRSVMDAKNPADPIAAQFVPSTAELNVAAEELHDPIGDATHSPLPGIVHRYPDRVLLQPSTVCAVYCRFCFRRETVGAGSQGLDDNALDAALAYIESKHEIWEVILSGGDPFILSPRRLERIMRRLDAIPHVGVVRFHTRVPVVKPDIIDDAFIRAIKIQKAVYVILHVNHVQELSEEAQLACAKLIDAGLPMLSQTVLLKNVNADAAALRALFKRLVELRIKPYYLHHGDLARGTSQFRTSIAEGQELMRTLRGRISGLCQATYVLDIPGGHGKVPIGPSYLTEIDPGHFVVCDHDNQPHDYRSQRQGEEMRGADVGATLGMILP